MDESNSVCLDAQEDHGQDDEVVYSITSPKQMIAKLEDVYNSLHKSTVKRDRLHNNFIKSLKGFLQKDFEIFCPEFKTASNQERLENYNLWLTSYIQNFFGREIDPVFNESLYGGTWGGFQFIFGSFISKDTMKQMISCSREKAYFYGLLKCFKNSSQKKLAIMLKSPHLVHLLDYVFQSDKISSILNVE